MAADPGRTRITRELIFAAFAGPSTETDDPRLLEKLSADVEAETVGPGHVLFREGEESTYVHFMSEGRMRLTCPDQPDWIYDGRWVVGTTDVLLGRPRARTAVMETEARLFRLPAARWFEVMDHRPEVLVNALIGFARSITGLYVRLAPDGGFAPAAGEAETVDVARLAGRTRLLASLALLRGMPMQSIVELADLAECQDLEPEAVLFSAGASPGRVFVVTRGHVEARHADPEVRAVFGPGTIVGGAVSLGDMGAEWSARALDRAQVLSFSTGDLFDHIEDHQEALRAAMAAFALERERACDVLASRLGELVLA